MRSLWFIPLLFISFSILAQKKAVIVLVDGIPADLIEQLDTPTLDAITKEGGFTRAIMGGEIGGETESPTISAVCYNTMLTGTWANKHNVYGNGIKDPNYQYWSIFRMVRESEPNANLAIFSTWEDNRTKLLGEGLDETGNLKLDISFDGYEKDLETFPHDPEKDYLANIDQLVSENAAETILQEGPDLSWVYLEHTDAVGHRLGDSPEMNAAVQAVDKRLGIIWEAVEQRRKETGEEWLILITTDHGRTLKDGKGHGGQSARERAIWIVTNAQGLNSNFKINQPEMVDIAPSLISFFGLEVPSRILDQLDGKSFIGEE